MQPRRATAEQGEALMKTCRAAIVATLLCWSGAAGGQGAAAPPPDPATIPMPNLAFTPTSEAEANYDKYFIFNRAATDLATAYADLRECDGYARGLSYRTDVPAGSPYASGLVGAAAIAVADAVLGSAQRRRERRRNMLTCMRFKEYRVFGLPKDLWEPFNFEEGNRTVPETERQRLLMIQARVASGPAPTVGEVRP